ncbi:MAG: hypothetical protein NVS4B3_26240 [Gemmatimonadaceae bacterium]
MYTAAALGGEIKRLAARSAYHSISIAGRDPLSNAEFLQAVFSAEGSPLPTLLDCDGERPEAIEGVRKFVTLVQVTMDPAVAAPTAERGVATLKAAAEAKLDHALVLIPRDDTSDGQLLRIVEQAHDASAKTVIVVELPGGGDGSGARRWITLADRVAALHGDVRVALRLPPPIGMN